MSRSTLTCILCPNGCELEIDWTNAPGGPAVVKVSGNSCPKGTAYATEEITAPVRTVTTTVRVAGGIRPLVPVRTAVPVPLSSVTACLKALRAVVLTAPVRIGERIAADIAGTGVSVIATRTVQRAAPSSKL